MILGCSKLSSGFSSMAMVGVRHAYKHLHSSASLTTRSQHQELFGLVGYLLQEKLESLLLDRQSKTESILMEKKEEIDIQGSFPGISLQQGCCHIFSLKTAHRSISWHSTQNTKEDIQTVMFFKRLFRPSRNKKEEKVKQMGADKSHNMSP